MGQAHTGLAQDLRAGAALLGQPVVLVERKRDLRRHDQDAFVPGRPGGWPDGWLHADDRQVGILEAQPRGSDARRGVAGDHHRLGATSRHVVHDAAREGEDLVGRLAAIGVVGRVTKVAEVLMRQLIHQVA